MDWTEDAGHENGNYQNKCLNCGCTFVGLKRRVLCRVCHETPTHSVAELEEAVRVLAAEAACGRIAREGSVLMWDAGEQQGSYPLLPTQWENAERDTDNNPIARAAVEKAREGA
jgi:hypothetical protein